MRLTGLGNRRDQARFREAYTDTTSGIFGGDGPFVLTAVALLVVVGGGALAARSDDDWLLLVVPAVVMLLVGILKLAEGIHRLVTAYERSLDER